MKLKFMITLLLLICSIFTRAQLNNKLSKLIFDKVVMYDFEGGKGIALHIIDEKGNLAKTVKKEIVLSKETIKELNLKLGKIKSYGGPTSACFEPHLGFVYYLKNNVVGHLTFCLDCNRLSSSIRLPALEQEKVEYNHEVYYSIDGLSESFRKYLYQLITKYDFSHGIKK